MGRVVHFEITADEPERAAAFYRKAFGWDVSGWGGGAGTYLLVTTGPADTSGINGAILPRQEHHQAVINTIDVDSWERAAEAVKQTGGQVITEKTAIPGVGHFAYCLDTEGNVFGILESEPAAEADELPAATAS